MTKLKKIIFFYPSFERGGVEIVLVNLIKYFLKKNIKVIIISANFDKNKIKNPNLIIRNIKTKKNIFIHDRITKALIASKVLIKELKNQNTKETLIFSLQGSSLSIILCKLFGFKIVVRNAEDPIYSTFFSENKILSFIVLFLKLITYNFASGIITNSRGSLVSLSKIVYDKKKIISIYNPYIKKILRKKKYNRKNYLLYVGRLAKQKDVKTLIYSFNLIHNQIDNFKLLIIGDGRLRKSLINLSNTLRLQKKIKFLGWKKNLNKYYALSKVFLMSSVYEGLGNVLIDAVNFDLPIITTNCKSGPSEIICNGKAGFLVPVANPKLMSRKIVYVINNYELAEKKALFAKKNISRFLVENNSKKYLSFLIEKFDAN
tara:strand:- start:197 stop:1318 length:1122 start_codon:yes stop_codon:yes gene_type:complete